MDSNKRLWEQFAPIKTQPTARFDYEGLELYDVARAVAQINANPYGFHCQAVLLATLEPQLNGVTVSGGIDAAYAASLSWEDATRPLLVGSYPNGEVRLLDGYHRLTKQLSEPGGDGAVAWILTPEQTAAIRLK